MIKNTFLEIIDCDENIIREYSLNSRKLAENLYSKKSILKKINSLFVSWSVYYILKDTIKLIINATNNHQNMKGTILAGGSGTRLYPTMVKRPNYSVLNKSKIKTDFKIEIRYWRDSLKDCIEKIKN